MHDELLWISAISFATAASISVCAHAAEPPAADRAAATASPSDLSAEPGLHGFELALRPGFGSAGGKSPVAYRAAPLAYHPDPGGIYDGSASPYGSGFAGQLGVGYRFLPFASAGIYGEMRNQSASGVSDGSSDIARSGWGAGFYARGYLPTLLERFDPYLELGVGYMNDTQTYRRGVATTLGSMPGDWKLDHHGIALPVAIGIDYRVLPRLAVGPSFRYARVFGAGACLGESVDTAFGAVSSKSCTDATDSQRITQAESYDVWSAGLDARLTL